MIQRTVEVVYDPGCRPTPLVLGHLNEVVTRGRVSYQFIYSQEALDTLPPEFTFDPHILRTPGIQHAPNHLDTFGFLADASPDRWGQKLIDTFCQTHKLPKPRTPLEYALAVHDPTRIGALRFRDPTGGDFIAGASTPVPAIYHLRNLETVCRKFQADPFKRPRDPQQAALYDELLRRGASLGGAQPKATIIDERKVLWLAKFSPIDAQYDRSPGEALCQKMAANLGLTTVPNGFFSLGPTRGIFLIQRFDRDPSQPPERQRIPYASASTMAGLTIGAATAEGASYLSIAAFLAQSGSQPAKDLPELWSRIVLNMAIQNTDDHLRNHGFLQDPDGGWRLSPLFDITPAEPGPALLLAVDGEDPIIDYSRALKAASYYQLTPHAAQARLAEIVNEVAAWRKTAADMAIPATILPHLEGNFQLNEAYAAQTRKVVSLPQPTPKRRR